MSTNPRKKSSKRNDEERTRSEDPLFEKFLFPALVGLLLLVVTASATYLIVGIDSDLGRVNEAGRLLEKKASQLASSNRMLDVWSGGWFASSNKNIDKKQKLLEPLLSFEGLKALSPSYANESIQWGNLSLVRLHQERETIASYTSSEELFKAYQASMLKFYDAEIRSIAEILETINIRSMVTVKQFDAFLASQSSSGLQKIGAASAMINLSNEISLDFEYLKTAHDREREKVHEIVWLAKAKIYASYIGLTIAFLVIGGLGFRWYERRL